MLVHPWDDTAGPEEWLGFLAAQGLGQLVAVGRDRALPVIVPTQYVVVEIPTADEPRYEVWLHLARPNPIWRVLAERPVAVLAVAGDWAYIPTDWNAEPGTPPRSGVPTTYYGAVQASGPVTVVDEAVGKVAILRRQLSSVQPDGGYGDPAAHDRLLPGIRGLRLAVDEVRAKFKYGGNKTEGHRRLIADRLRERDQPGDSAARTHLLRRLAPGTEHE